MLLQLAQGRHQRGPVVEARLRTRKVTMQNLFHDGGFSSVGMSLRAMATYEKGLDEYKDENGHIIYG